MTLIGLRGYFSYFRSVVESLGDLMNDDLEWCLKVILCTFSAFSCLLTLQLTSDNYHKSRKHHYIVILDISFVFTLISDVITKAPLKPHPAVFDKTASCEEQLLVGHVRQTSTTVYTLCIRSVLVMAFDCIHGRCPAYFEGICTPVHSVPARARLRSADHGELITHAHALSVLDPEASVFPPPQCGTVCLTVWRARTPHGNSSSDC